MIRTPRILTALALGAALTGTVSKAQADEDFLWGLGIGLGVGVIGTTIAHDHHHSHGCGHRGYYHEPVVYRTYQPEVRYIDRAVYPENSYVEYKETKVWPFYKKVNVEVIPALPAAPQGRPQAVRMKPSAAATRSVDAQDGYGDEAAPETQTLREKVEDVKSSGAGNGRVTQVSNKAGRVVTLPAREAAVPAPKVKMVENASGAKDAAKIEI